MNQIQQQKLLKRRISKSHSYQLTQTLPCLNLQLAQWPLRYKFNMVPTFEGQSDPRQFLMSFKAAVISGGDDETTLAKSLLMAVKGPAQQ